jgi:hypothetical protein
METRRKKHKDPKPSSGFMNRRQVADEFGFSESFIAHLPTSVLPKYGIGSKVLYDREEVIAAIKSRQFAAPTGRRGRPKKPVLPGGGK